MKTNSSVFLSAILFSSLIVFSHSHVFAGVVVSDTKDYWYKSGNFRAKTSVLVHDNGRVDMKTFFQNGQKTTRADMQVIVEIVDDKGYVERSLRQCVDDFNPSWFGGPNEHWEDKSYYLKRKDINAKWKIRFTFLDVAPPYHESESPRKWHACDFEYERGEYHSDA